MTVVDALAALTEGDVDEAAAIATRVADQDPQSRLAVALARHLGEPQAAGVYDEAGAFEQFIDNGGNVALYRNTIAQMAAIHERLRPERVLDIGCGDGRVTTGSLGAPTVRVDLVEPSAELLQSAVVAAERPGVAVVGHRLDASSFLSGVNGSTTWDLTQSTFALHTLDPDTRSSVLRRLAGLTSVLVVVEFDVPAFADRSAEHLAYLAERYELGVREYEDLPEVVSGFLLPVLLGQVDPDRPRHTFEQPVSGWVREIRAAGFTTSTRPVSSYWWADAVLMEAVAPAG
jgi:SAM-dependent methyltransferase